MAASFDYTADVNADDMLSAMKPLMAKVKVIGDAVSDHTSMNDTQFMNVNSEMMKIKASVEAVSTGVNQHKDKVDTLLGLNLGASMAAAEAEIIKLQVIVDPIAIQVKSLTD